MGESTRSLYLIQLGARRKRERLTVQDMTSVELFFVNVEHRILNIEYQVGSEKAVRDNDSACDYVLVNRRISRGRSTRLLREEKDVAGLITRTVSTAISMNQDRSG